MTLLIDNYDSFSYNLYQLVGQIDPSIRVIRNDKMTVGQIAELMPERILLSPGPGRPEDAGVTMEVAATLGKQIPTLGVCLGHQAICAAFGAKIVHAGELMHGKQSEVTLDTDCPLFFGCPKQTKVARYHSLAVEAASLPSELNVTAVVSGRKSGKEIMAVQHREYPIFGVQFHPESILTPEGLRMLKNFIAYSSEEIKKEKE